MKIKLVRGLFILLLVFGTLAALFYAEENWRGAKAWEKIQVEFKNEGEPLTIAEIIPPPIPDDGNVAMAPLFVEVFAVDKAASEGKKDIPPTAVNYLRKGIEKENVKPKKNSNPGRGEPLELPDAQKILDYFNRNTAEMAGIEAALGRPFIRWNLDYTKGFELPLPHVTAALEMSKLLQLRAQAHIVMRQSDDALKDVRLIIRCGDLMRRDNFLIGHLVSITCDNLAYQVIWEGMQRRLWNETQLEELQKLQRNTDYVADFQHSMRWERVVFLDILSRMKADDLAKITGLSEKPNSMERMAFILFKLRPKGWQDQERVYCCQIHRSAFMQSSDSPQLVADTKDAFKKIQKDRAFIPNVFYRPLISISMPAIDGAFRNTINTMAGFRMVAAAAAIERYRIAKGKLPPDLETLVPSYLNEMPLDPVDGRPLRYLIKTDDGYLLYSIGWNGSDEGGVTTRNRDLGDWVWPSKPGLVEIREK